MADKRQKWTVGAERALVDIVKSLSDSRPRRGRKAHHDEMDAPDWWALVARRLRTRCGIAVTGDACARRLRTIESRQDARFTVDATGSLTSDAIAEIADALETISAHTQKIAKAIDN